MRNPTKKPKKFLADLWGGGCQKRSIFSQVLTKKGLKTPKKLSAALKGGAFRSENWPCGPKKWSFQEKMELFFYAFLKNERYRVHLSKITAKSSEKPENIVSRFAGGTAICDIACFLPCLVGGL